MNNKKFCIILLILVISFVGLKVKADTYTRIHLNVLNEIKDNQSLLDTVEYVTISETDDLSLVNLLYSCNNLKELTFSDVTIDDLTFINNIATNDYFALIFYSGFFKLNGVYNDYIDYIRFDYSHVTNFSNGMLFPNLKTILIKIIDGYEDIDYSIYSNLHTLSLSGICISDYQVFFDELSSLNQLISLDLSNANINDNDTKYLKQNTTIENLNLYDTNIMSMAINAARDMYNKRE